MKCQKIQTWLAQRVLGLLPAARTAPLEQHLAQCPACRQWAEKLEQGIQALQTSNAGTPPANLADRIVERARVQTNPTPGRSTWWWIPALASAVVLLTVLTQPWWHPTESSQVTSKEVLLSYEEDLKSLGIVIESTESESETGNGNGNMFQIPNNISQYIL